MTRRTGAATARRRSASPATVREGASHYSTQARRGNAQRQEWGLGVTAGIADQEPAGGAKRLVEEGYWSMLVLRRKAGEAIVLNGSITIYVLAVEGERVKLGISAPPDVVIVRSELLDGPGAPMGAPMSGPLGGIGGPPMGPGGSGSYARPPRPPMPPMPPERSWREPERPWREPDGAGRPRPTLPPMSPTPPMPPTLRRAPDEEANDSYSGQSRYTPRSRYDTYTPYSSVRDDRENAPHPDDTNEPDADR